MVPGGGGGGVDDVPRTAVVLASGAQVWSALRVGSPVDELRTLTNRARQAGKDLRSRNDGQYGQNVHDRVSDNQRQHQIGKRISPAKLVNLRGAWK